MSEPYPVEPTYPTEPEPGGSEHMRWVQDCLNQVLGLKLPLNGVMGVETRSAVRSFQRRQGLPVRGIVGPDTQEAFKRACSGAGPQASDDTQATGEFGLETEEEGLGNIFGRITSGIGSAYGRAVDVLSGTTTGSRIVDLTAQADKSVRKGTRDPKTVNALVLHQMACCFKPKDPLKRFLSLGAHFGILPDGRILQLHPISALVWASNGFNKGSVAVEFAGNFPSVKGKWWKGDTYGKNHPTQAQFEAGRYLIRHLMRTMGLTHVLAHRQSSGTRENDPGPDIWYHVGQWAVDNLGLKDGGPGFKDGTGNPIPDAWRTSGRRPAAPEMSPELEAELSETELAHDVWQGEDHSRSPEYVRRVQPLGKSLNEEKTMHYLDCTCPKCRTTGAFEWGESEFPSVAEVYTESEGEGPFSEAEEMELAAELLSVSSEAEMDQFLGKLFKGAWKGIKKVGSFVGKIAKPLGGVLKGVAKAALPIVGGALGSFIPIPGVGTAVGSALGGALSKALELEFPGLNQEEQEFEMARRFVRIAGTTAQQAALASPSTDPQAAVKSALIAAARRHVGGLPDIATAENVMTGRSRGSEHSGRWVRHGNRIVVMGA